MSTTINWDKLVAEDRAKAHGVPWTNEELSAIYDKGISPEKVRRGIITEEEDEKDEKEYEEKARPWYHESVKGMINIAKELGIDFDEKAVDRNDLMNIIKVERKKQELTTDAINKINQAVNH